jgi:membrane-bound lytic murein transglycosylase A
MAAGVPARSEADPEVKAPDMAWKIRIVKAKTAAPSKSAPTAKGVAAWYRPVTFAELPGWAQDDHLAAFKTFLKSCERVVANGRDRPAGDAKAPQAPPAALVAVCQRAGSVAGEIATKEKARAFFEASFTPNAVVKKGRTGLLTGYYEPVLEGSRTPEGRYQTPIYKRPPDLVNVVDDTRRGALKAGALTHVRKTETGTEPYFTRAQIEAGALKGKGLELLYFADPVEVFFMQIQGSGRVKLTDGTTVRVHYDGKNGHPYSSIGRYLTEKALFAADKMSMAALMAWLKADTERGKQVMWQNTSFVFFREIRDDTGAPLGAMRVPLTPGRSLAIDTAFHALGMPVYVNVPTMKHVPRASPFNRLMVGQDVGSAIRGPERGDIYFGSGEEAGKFAGSTKHPGRFFVLVPNAPAAETAAGPAAPKAQP